MSNEQKKYTPEEWKVIHTNGYHVVNTVGKFIASQVSKIEAERIVSCVNAMEGIEDPEMWKIQVNNDLAQNKIDMDHADSVISELMGILKQVLSRWGIDDRAERSPVYKDAKELLNKIQQT